MTVSPPLPDKTNRIAVALSGGVDSAVAAHLMREAGYSVVAIHMKVHPNAAEAVAAKAVADQLHLPFFCIDVADAFQKQVAGYLTEAYLAGKTPNPCAVCNRLIKFGLFLQLAQEAAGGFDTVVTGHYARIRQLQNARWTVEKGSDTDKDQAYFLSLLTQKQLRHLFFPLADLTKSEVRSIAARCGLPNSGKKESQDLCIGHYLQFIPRGSGAGDYVDLHTGRVIGRHRGIEHYTVGQRRGLQIGGAAAPQYAVKIDRAANRVYVGSEADLLATELWISHINWMGTEIPAGQAAPASSSGPVPPWKGSVKIRYRDNGCNGELTDLAEKNGCLWGRIRFTEPVRAVTPGQLAVAYEGNAVAFAGFIEAEPPFRPTEPKA